MTDNLTDMSAADFDALLARRRDLDTRASDLLALTEVEVTEANARLAEAELHQAADLDDVREALRAAEALRNGRAGSRAKAATNRALAEAEHQRRLEMNANTVSADADAALRVQAVAIARRITKYSAQVATMLGELRTRMNVAQQASYQAREVKGEKHINRVPHSSGNYSEGHVLDGVQPSTYEVARMLEAFSGGQCDGQRSARVATEARQSALATQRAIASRGAG